MYFLALPAAFSEWGANWRLVTWPANYDCTMVMKQMHFMKQPLIYVALISISNFSSTKFQGHGRKSKWAEHGWDKRLGGSTGRSSGTYQGDPMTLIYLILWFHSGVAWICSTDLHPSAMFLPDAWVFWEYLSSIAEQTDDEGGGPKPEVSTFFNRQ